MKYKVTSLVAQEHLMYWVVIKFIFPFKLNKNHETLISFIVVFSSLNNHLSKLFLAKVLEE